MLVGRLSVHANGCSENVGAVKAWIGAQLGVRAA